MYTARVMSQFVLIYDFISRQLHNPVSFFIIVELNSKLLNALHIFKI